jgi:hypothetical protein
VSKNVWRRLFRSVRRTALLLVLLALGLGAYAVLVGIPGSLTGKLLQRWDSPERDFVVETGTVRWRPWLGFVADNVKLYRKGSIAPAVCEVERLAFRIDPWERDASTPVTGDLEASGVRLRPDVTARDDREWQERFPAAASLPIRRAMSFSVRIRDVEGLGLRVRDGRARVVLERDLLRVEDLRADLENGQSRGTLHEGRLSLDLLAQTLRVQVETRLDPRMLLPLMTRLGATHAMEQVETFDFFAEPPRCQVTARAGWAGAPELHLETEFFLKDFRYIGTDVLRADGKFAVTLSPNERRVAVAPLFLVRAEGIASAEIAVDALRHTVEFDAASTLHPPSVARMVGLPPERFPEKLVFEGGANLSARGTIHYRDMQRTEIEGSLSGRGLRADFVHFHTYALNYRMTNLTHALDNVRGRLYGGHLTGAGALTTPAGGASPPPRFTLAFSLEDVDFDRFLADANPKKEQDYEGIFSLHLDMAGEAGPAWTEALSGNGKARIKDGRMLMLPIFGGLTEMLSRYVPGVDFLARQDYFRSEFTIADGKIKTDKATIEGNIVRIQGRGDLGLDGSLDFRVGLRLLRDRNVFSYITDIPTWIFNLLFEFELRGTVKKPEWSPFGPTMDLLRKLGLRKD